MCDWIASTVIYEQTELSITDVVDTLIEEEKYTTEDFAYEMLGNVWMEFRRRQHCIGGEFYPLEIHNRWIRAQCTWRQSPAYAFCLLLSIAPYYDWWASEIGGDYNEQGELFELLTKESLEAQYQEWRFLHTGWARSNTAGLERIVNEIAEHLGESQGRLALWNEPNVKELGLDLLFYRSYPDGRVGIPVYLMQCASGGNWHSKRNTPDLNIWGNVVQFTTMPKRAFAVPFALEDKEFTQPKFRTLPAE